MSSSPTLYLMFSTCKEYSCEEVPGFIHVPVSKFTAAGLNEYVSNKDNMEKAMMIANKYVSSYRKFEKLHAQLEEILPEA
mmetsp:Transcript_24079/g.37024  ORF Transcript_24079/g.37024 Transcript_24079/m.37024 type:complete len:80 (-) Transcript_24079:255-494(-)